MFVHLRQCVCLIERGRGVAGSRERGGGGRMCVCDVSITVSEFVITHFPKHHALR